MYIEAVSYATEYLAKMIDRFGKTNWPKSQLAVGVVLWLLLSGLCAFGGDRQDAAHGLMFNLDGHHFFVNHDAQADAGLAIDRLVDFYASAGVKTFLCNINGQRTSYNSKVWETWWDGYDPEGPDHQPLLRRVLPAEIASHRKLFNTFVAVERSGIDYPARVIQRCRERSMEAWLSVRMNDAHGVESDMSPWPSQFVRESPHLSRVSYQKFMRADRALDYAHAKVREHYRKLIDELLTRYDMDGLELDFCRQPFLFGIGRELEGRAIITNWIHSIRERTNATATKRGHRLHLAVRVPSEPETCRNLGLDVVKWARNDLVDVVIVASGGVSLSSDFNMPMRLWRSLLKPYDVSLAGCVEPSVAACHHASSLGMHGQAVDPALAVGAATAILDGGADAVYLFNFFREVLTNSSAWSDKSIRNTFSAMNSLESLATLRRRHVVSLRTTIAPGELCLRPPIMQAGEATFVDAALPAKGKYAIFRLQTGPKPMGRDVQVVLATHDSRKSSISIRVNGVPCDLAAREEHGDRLRFDVAEEALADEAHVVEAYSNLVDGPPFTITWVECDISALH